MAALAQALLRRLPRLRRHLDGHASDGTTLVCWGTARMTMTGDRFFFDLSALCAQSGVSTDAVRRKVFGS